MLLPILARLLKVDLNTLFSFNECLTELEIKHFTDELMLKMKETEDFEIIFQLAIKKIHEYPFCELLVVTLTSLLEKFMLVYSIEKVDTYQENLEKLYEKLMNSSNEKFRNHAISLLIERYLIREDYNKVELLINSIPDSILNKRAQQVSLYIRQERFSEVNQFLEEGLGIVATDIQLTLLGMVQVALKEMRFDDADYYADLYEKTTRIYFSHIDFITYQAHFEIAVAKKDTDEIMRLLRLILNATKKGVDTTSMPFHRSNVEKRNEVSEFGLILANQTTINIINSIKNDEGFEFLREHAGYEDLLLLLFDDKN